MIKKRRLVSKYLDLDIENMPDEEFNAIAKDVYISAAVRSVGGILLFIACILLFVFCC